MSVVRSREVSGSRRFQMYYLYGKINRGHRICPLYRGCPLFRVSANRGFTEIIVCFLTFVYIYICMSTQHLSKCTFNVYLLIDQRIRHPGNYHLLLDLLGFKLFGVRHSGTHPEWISTNQLSKLVFHSIYKCQTRGCELFLWRCTFTVILANCKHVQLN